jgi:hypothetical protein
MPVKKKIKKALNKIKKTSVRKPKPSNFKDMGRIGQSKTRKTNNNLKKASKKVSMKPSRNRVLPVLDMKNPIKVNRGRYSVKPIYT